MSAAYSQIFRNQLDGCETISSQHCEGPLRGYCVEEVERQQFREVSDHQALGDRSMAASLASLGWQDFYLNVNVPVFFNTIGRKRSFNPSASLAVSASTAISSLAVNSSRKTRRMRAWPFSNASRYTYGVVCSPVLAVFPCTEGICGVFDTCCGSQLGSSRTRLCIHAGSMPKPSSRS